MLIITPRAQAMIAQLAGESPTPGESLRIDLHAGGCCGTYFAFTVDRPYDGDAVVGQLYMSPAAASVLAGARLDYGPTLKPPRFRVLNNPNLLHKCACGRSFGRPFPGKETPECQAYVPMPWDD